MELHPRQKDEFSDVLSQIHNSQILELFNAFKLTKCFSFKPNNKHLNNRMIFCTFAPNGTHFNSVFTSSAFHSIVFDTEKGSYKLDEYVGYLFDMLPSEQQVYFLTGTSKSEEQKHFNHRTFLDILYKKNIAFMKQLAEQFISFEDHRTLCYDSSLFELEFKVKHDHSNEYIFSADIFGSSILLVNGEPRRRGMYDIFLKGLEPLLDEKYPGINFDFFSKSVAFDDIFIRDLLLESYKQTDDYKLHSLFNGPLKLPNYWVL